jgi:integrase
MRSRSTVDKFLAAQALGLKSRYTYAGLLRAFDAFVPDREGSGLPSMETLRAWLQQDIQRSPLANVVHRACVIARYLDWRSAPGRHPHVLAQLRAQYGHHLNPIVQALLQDDYELALQRLRPLKPWGSVLGAAMQEHVMRMKGLGYRYEARMRDLLRFDRFLQRHPGLSAASLPEQLKAWGHESRGIRHQLKVQQCGLVLSKALHRRDTTAKVLSIEVGLQRRVVQQQRRPYVFTEDEIKRLLDAAQKFPSHNAPLRPVALHAMITLAYCAGLRLGEIVSLTLATGVLSVLRTYLDARAAAGAPSVPEAPMWWSPLRRQGYSYGATEKLLIRVLRSAGLKPEYGRSGARVHDLRHNSEFGIIPSTASNDAARSEVSSWEGHQRCSELSETLQEVHQLVAGLESSQRDLPRSCVGKRTLLQLHVCMQVDGCGLR